MARKKPLPGMHRLHAVTFDDPAHCIAAVKALADSGYRIADVHSPFPLHGIDVPAEIPETRLAWGTLLGGLTGLSFMAWFEIWTHTSDWPLTIAGKTHLALPALVPVAFEFTVLLAAFATVGGLLLRSGLWPRPAGDTPRWQPGPRVTDDHFVVVVDERDGGHDPHRFAALLAPFAPVAMEEAWRVR